MTVITTNMDSHWDEIIDPQPDPWAHVRDKD